MKEIRKIYVAHFFAGFATVASVTYTLYFLSHGINQFQIAQLFGFFMIALALLEIPTGGFADTFGHKASVTLGIFSQSLSSLLFFLFPNYLGFLIGMFMSALGLALQSGALSSLIYELLKKENIHADFQKIYGKANGYFLIAGIIAAPLGSWIYSMYPLVPYFLSFVVLFLAGIAVSLVKWEFVKKAPSFSRYKGTIISGVKLTLQHRILMGTVVIGIALTTNRLLMNQNISQPYLVNIGVEVAYIGFIAAAISGILAVVYMYSHKITQIIGKNLSLLLIVFLPGASVVALGFIDNLLGLAVMLILAMSHAFRDPVIMQITQDELDSDKRSTMASTTSFFISITVGLLLPFFGNRIDTFGMSNTLFMLGSFTFVVGAVGLLLINYKEKYMPAQREVT